MLEKTEELGDRADRLINHITYKHGYTITFGYAGSSVYIRVRATLDGEVQKGRKWLIEDEMTDTEIVLTILKAILTFEEHEAREAFRYKGARIFGPHLDLDQLREFARKKDNLSLRN